MPVRFRHAPFLCLVVVGGLAASGGSAHASASLPPIGEIATAVVSSSAGAPDTAAGAVERSVTTIGPATSTPAADRAHPRPRAARVLPAPPAVPAPARGAEPAAPVPVDASGAHPRGLHGRVSAASRALPRVGARPDGRADGAATARVVRARVHRIVPNRAATARALRARAHRLLLDPANTARVARARAHSLLLDPASTARVLRAHGPQLVLDDAATTRGLRARGRELLLDGAAAARWAVVDGISAVSDVRLDRVTAAQDRVTAALGASLPCVIAAPDHPSAAPEALVDYPTSPPRIDARLPAASSAAPGSSAPAFTRLRTVAATWDTRAHTLPRSRTATADRALGASRGPRNAAVRAPAPCSDATAASGASASAPCDRPELVIARPPHAFVAHPAPAALPPRPAVAVPDARPG